MPGLAGHSPDYRGVKIVTGAHIAELTLVPELRGKAIWCDQNASLN